MSSRPQPALPGASHGQRGSWPAGPPHLAPLWAPAATLQAVGACRELHDIHIRTYIRNCIPDIKYTTHIRILICMHARTHAHTHTHCLTCTCSGEVAHCRAASELHPCMTGGGPESSAHNIQRTVFIQGHPTRVCTASLWQQQGK